MPFYQKRGKIPSKKHTQFRNETGELFSEELVSRGGFSSVYSNIYHTNPPTALKAIGKYTAQTCWRKFQTPTPAHRLVKYKIRW